MGRGRARAPDRAGGVRRDAYPDVDGELQLVGKEAAPQGLANAGLPLPACGNPTAIRRLEQGRMKEARDAERCTSCPPRWAGVAGV